MNKPLLILLLPILFGFAACTKTTVPPTPEPVLSSEATSLPETLPSPTKNLPPSPAGTEPIQTASAPVGLRVVYVRAGNVWSWSEADGNVQLTGTGDISTVHLSEDGQLLAFMRGGEIWTVRMDGTDARMLVTQAAEGGALWFAPNVSLLAFSTSDHIDVIDLNTASSTTVVTYPAIPDAYYPEVSWTPDALGFKTVIPPQTETGQAEFLFVFTNGKVGSLAKFPLVPLSKDSPYISPDGGYIIYSTRLADGKETLNLMDSSGATRVYGEPGENIRAYGWLPDSKHFVYGNEINQKTYLGEVTGAPKEIPLTFSPLVRWVDMDHFLELSNGELNLGTMDGEKMLIDTAVQGFDFVY
jgi:hypothetical protein